MDERDREEQAVDYFAYPEPAMMHVFLNHHPKQDAKNPVVKKVFTTRDGKSRNWLTYCNERHALFCFLCLAFSKPTDSIFLTGMSDWRHVHQRAEEHEKSRGSLISLLSKTTVNSVIDPELNSAKHLH